MGGKDLTRRGLFQTVAAAASPVLIPDARADRQAAARQEVAHAPADSDPLSRLRQGHPRLVLLDSEIESRIRPLIRDNPLAKRLFTDLEKEAERLQTTLPVEYKFILGRQPGQSRRALDRISVLALLFRLTGKEAYLHRAILEMKAAASFRDWNPGHFIDTADMTHALAIGYDWLYPALSFEDRAWMAGAIVNKGIDPALAAYQSNASWTTSRFFSNPVCNSGIVLGALAVAEDFPGKSASILKAAFESLPKAMSTWAPDGSWPEGLAYWDVATRAAAIVLGASESALIGDSTLINATHGLDRAGRFRTYLTGPLWKLFNFGDCSEDAAPAPEMQWLARRYGNPLYAWEEQRLIDRPGSRADVLDLVWFARDSKPPQMPQWPLDAVFHGVNVATFRSSWEDPNALFLAAKGGDNKVPHTHFDLGSFVLDAGGVRFAADLGPDDQPQLPALLPGNSAGNPAGPAAGGPQGGSPGRFRSGSYRARTEVHNTLLLDSENQDLSAEARITRQEFSADLSWIQIDLSKANGSKTKVWQRRIGMAQRQAVLIEDVLESDHALEVVWGMLTDADISVNGQNAVLQKGKWSLSAEIRSPRHAVFDLASVRAQGYRRLIIRLGEKTTDLNLSVSLTPYRTGTPKPKITVQFPV